MGEWIKFDVIEHLQDSTKNKPSFSRSSLMFFGILLEDVPQLIVTFLIEDKIRSDDPTGRISQTALLNLTLAIFDILHKITEALDLLNDVHNAGYKYKKWIKAHSYEVYLLAVAGGNMILSASRDGTVKLWNMTKCKFNKHHIQTYKFESAVYDVVAIGSSKIIAACGDKKIHILNFETGEALGGSPIELEFEPTFISLSPDSKSVYTSRHDALSIQSFDIETKALITTYSQPAAVLAFLDNHKFVSSGLAYAFECNFDPLLDNCTSVLYGSPKVSVWNVGTSQPIQTIELENDDSYGAVEVMSPTMFFIGDGNLIKGFVVNDNDIWTCKYTFMGHTDNIRSLTKVNETLFVSTSKDGSAKLWDTTKEPACVYTFLAHTSILDREIFSSVYLKEEKAIATGDAGGNIVVWSIAKYFDNNLDTEEDDEAQNRLLDGLDAAGQEMSDQEPIAVLEP